MGSSPSPAPTPEPTGTRPGSVRSIMASPARTAGWGPMTTILAPPSTLSTGPEIDVKESGKIQRERCGTHVLNVRTIRLRPCFIVTRTTPSDRPLSRTVTARPARFTRLITRPRRVTVSRPPRIAVGGWITSERRGTQRATGGGGGAVAFADNETLAAGPLLGTENVAA